MSIISLFQESPFLALVFLVSIIAAVAVHEFAHAWAADRLGDDTPRLQGRLTLNPAAHLDPLGSLVFLLVGFGWGRPVSYNPMRLSRRSDELLIALAGPASNLLFALFLNAFAHLTANALPLYGGFLQFAASINVLLASFNLIPVPPLDGSSIVAYFWPSYRSMLGGQVGLVILLVILYLPFGGANIIGTVLTPIENAFTSFTTLGGIL